MAGAVEAREEKDQRWRPLFEFMKDKPHGYVITYKQLQVFLGGDATGNRFDIYRAGKELERLSHRTLVCVRGQGYRIAEPKEHENLAHDRQRYARRHIKRAQNIIAAADRTALTPDEAARLANLEAHMSRVHQALGGHEKRIAKLEESAAKQADLEARLSRLEQAVQGATGKH